jgi:hypothetical protein
MAPFQEALMVQWAGIIARNLSSGITGTKAEAHKFRNWLPLPVQGLY